MKDQTKTTVALEPHFAWWRLQDLSGPQVHELIRVRESVFVVEQHCAYPEADELDLQARHLLARVGDRLVGYLRVMAPASAVDHASIGRVLVVPACRGHGLGVALVDEALAYLASAHPGRGIHLNAQTYLQAFYENLGFTAVGERYLEDGIPHIGMCRPAG